MTQKEILQRLVNSVEKKFIKVYLITSWLEDINFHSENKVIIEKYLNEESENFLGFLEQLNVCMRKPLYEKKHFEGLVKSGFIKPEYYDIVENLQDKTKLRTYTPEGCKVQYDYAYLRMCIREFNMVREFQNTLSYAYGWSVENSLYPDKQTFLKNIDEILTPQK